MSGTISAVSPMSATPTSGTEKKNRNRANLKVRHALRAGGVIRTFLKKIDSYLEKYIFARRFEGLNSTKFLEILHNNKSSNKFLNH